MKIKTKIMFRLKDNFCWVLYALSCSFIHWASHAFLNHSQLPEMEENSISEAFPSRVIPLTTIYSCPNKILGASQEDLHAVSVHVSISICSVIFVALLAWTLLWPAIWPWDPCWCGFCYSLHPSCFPLTPLQPGLAHVAFVIRTVVDYLSFFCHPLLGCHS